jgi:hypothetical protein
VDRLVFRCEHPNVILGNELPTTQALRHQFSPLSVSPLPASLARSNPG